MIDALASYNDILGRSTMNPHWMVHSTYHHMMHFPTHHGIEVGRGGQPVVRTCYVHSVRCHVLNRKESLAIQTEDDPREERSRPQQVEGMRKLENDGLEKTVQIGATLPNKEAEGL